MTDTLEVFETVDHSWAWHRQAGNGEVIAQGETHSRREDAVRAAERACPDLKVAE